MYAVPYPTEGKNHSKRGYLLTSQRVTAQKLTPDQITLYSVTFVPAYDITVSSLALEKFDCTFFKYNLANA